MLHNAVDDLEYERARTLAIVRRLSQGEILTLDNGVRIGMSPDMTIGVIYESIKNGQTYEHIGPLATFDLAALNSFLNKHNIGMPIPK